MTRAREIEEAFVREGERRAGLESSGYRAEVMGRLEMGSKVYGELLPADYDASRIAREIHEEALDVAGWGAIGWELMLSLGDIGFSDGDRARELLCQASAYGALLSSVTGELKELARG